MRKILSPTARIGAFDALAALAVAACGGGGDPDGSSPTDVPTGRPTVVVTTSVWGDIVTEALGDTVDVGVLIPLGADPHDFAPSARQAEQMENADLVVINGLGLEAGMTDLIAAVAGTGTPVFAIADAVVPVESQEGLDDPHIWMDPVRVGTAVEALGDELVARTALDEGDLDDSIEQYTTQLDELDEQIRSALEAIPAEQRLLVTNHDSMAYFAERYRVEIVGTVIPSNSTSASASASDLVELAETIRELGVPAIFAETTESDELARALADEVGGPIAVVELYTGSLGPAGSGAESYVGLMTTNADRIAAALG